MLELAPAHMQPSPNLPVIDVTLITPKQCGEILQVDPEVITGLIESGQLPGCRFGGQLRIDLADLKLFIKATKK
jgi:excisionase family DNA binding protein